MFRVGWHALPATRPRDAVMTSLWREALARLKYGAECAWLATSSAGWALLYFVDRVRARVLERQIASCQKELDAAEAQYENVRAALATKRGSVP